MVKRCMVRQLSAPLAPMALAAVDAGQTVMAIQLYSGQVHTNRMDMTPVLDFIEAQSAKGKPVVRIEGSASDGPSSRAGGNMELASSRAMDVYLRLVAGWPIAGWKKGRDYEVDCGAPGSTRWRYSCVVCPRRGTSCKLSVRARGCGRSLTELSEHDGTSCSAAPEAALGVF